MSRMAYFSFLFSISFFPFQNSEWAMEVPRGHTLTKVLPRLNAPPGDSSNLQDDNCGVESTPQAYLILSLPTATALVHVIFICPWTPPVASHLVSLPPLFTP